ncbi:uncharacterized protein JCM6883_000047 [Sporobolomyces salmoneus]|uniref:uncharacterized protein n=1 Tax=Sporobolomyces salmoneus TaxID=183962 RepID=UPI003179EF86
MPRTCQHLFCTTCLHRALDLSSTCPIDRTRIRNRREELVEAPRVVKDLLGELRVRCNECKEEMKREEWDRHTSNCEETSELGKAGEIEKSAAGDGDGTSAEEDKVEKVCELCEERVRLRDLSEHLESCSKVPRPCRYCSRLVPSSSHASHLLDSCPLVPTPCPHASFGCTYIGPRETLPTDHLYSECAYEPLKDCFERFKDREREWELENWQLRRKVEGLEHRLLDVERLLGDTKHSLGDFLVTSPSLETRESDQTLPPAPLAKTLSTLSSRNNALSTSLNTVTQSHTDSLHTTQHLVEELNSMRSVIGGMRMQMGDLMRTVQYLSSTTPNGASRERFSGVGLRGDGSGNGRRGTRPVLGSRRSDSSSDDQEQELYPDAERYLSSSASDPEEDLFLFSSPSMFSNQSDPFPRTHPPHLMPLNPRTYSHIPPTRSSWTPGFDYGSGGGGGGGPPSLFNFGPGPALSRPPYLGSGHADRRNGRVVGGIGGGMKL